MIRRPRHSAASNVDIAGRREREACKGLGTKEADDCIWKIMWDFGFTPIEIYGRYD